MMERITLSKDENAMIDRRVMEHMKMMKSPCDFQKTIRDIYFQGFADCYEVMRGVQP